MAAQAELDAGDLWRQGSPGSQGLSAAKLEALREGLATRHTKALLVIREDTIVCEWHAPGQDANTRFGTALLFVVACAARFQPERGVAFRYGKRIDDLNLKALAAYGASVESILEDRFMGN